MPCSSSAWASTCGRELVALKDVNGDAEAFAKLAKTIAETSEFNLILMSDNVDVMKAGRRPPAVSSGLFSTPPPRPTWTQWAPWPRRTFPWR
jgi:hypothetical protein